MSRAATPTEVGYFAEQNQWSICRAIIDDPEIVFACLVNQVFTSYDRVAAITFDGVTTGAYGDVYFGQTVMVGSAAGLSDYGMTYIRKAATSTRLFVAVSSGVYYPDNAYITVINDWSIFPKNPSSLTDGSLLINYDEVYTDQMSTRKAIISAGGDRVLELVGADVSDDFTLTGAATYVTACAGATVDGDTTDTPTVTIDTAGRYVVKIVATAANGKVTTTYRIINVWDTSNPPPTIVLSNNQGSINGGGWSAHVRTYAPVTLRDRQRVQIFADDYYGATRASVGALAGCENIVLTGWVDAQSVVQDKDKGVTEFDVYGPAYWLDKTYDLTSVSLTHVSTTPANFREMQDLTIDIAIWNLFENYSTLLNCCDLLLTGDTRKLPGELVTPASGLLAQANSILENIQAYLTVNQYGQVIAQIDVPLLPVAGRGSVPTVTTLTGKDFESIDIDKIVVTTTSQVVLAGLYANGTQSISYYALAPGHTPLPHGSPTSPATVYTPSQAALNETAGNMLAKDNRPYKFSITGLRGNNRLIDIAGQQRIDLTIVAADNALGLEFSGHTIIRSISRSHDPETGAWTIDMECEAETVATLYTNGDVPVVETVTDTTGSFDDAWTPPEMPPFDSAMEPFEPFDPVTIAPEPTPVDEPRYCWLVTEGKLFYTRNLDAAATDVAWYRLGALMESIEGVVVNNAGRYYAWNSHEIFTGVYDSSPTRLAGDYFFRDEKGHPSTLQIYAVGVMPGEDKIIVITSDNPYSGIANSWTGTSAGLVYADQLSLHLAYRAAEISYSINKWILTTVVGGGDTPYSFRFAEDGTEEGAFVNIPTQFPYHVRAGTSDICWCTYHNGGSGSVKVYGNGETRLLNAGFSFSGARQATGVDPTGQYLIAANQAYDPYRSNDFGATWNLFFFPKVDARYAAIKGIDANRFVFASGAKEAGYHDSGVYVTVDFGDTWSDNKIGNLAVMTTLGDEFQPAMIQVLP